MSLPFLYTDLLIIDDDVEDQEIFLEALREVDPQVQCRCANSGEEAMELLKSGAPVQLIFLDMNMPKQNGKQVLREIRTSFQFREIPVIMYSTSFAPRDIDDIAMIGAVHHLLKPSRFDELCRSLRELLLRPWIPRPA